MCPQAPCKRNAAHTRPTLPTTHCNQDTATTHRNHYPPSTLQLTHPLPTPADAPPRFANLWPDELSTVEPLRDLGYSPQFGLSDMVAKVLEAHEDRNQKTAQAFARSTLAHTIAPCTFNRHLHTIATCTFNHPLHTHQRRPFTPAPPIHTSAALHTRAANSHPAGFRSPITTCSHTRPTCSRTGGILSLPLLSSSSGFVDRSSMAMGGAPCTLHPAGFCLTSLPFPSLPYPGLQNDRR